MVAEDDHLIDPERSYLVGVELDTERIGVATAVATYFVVRPVD